MVSIDALIRMLKKFVTSSYKFQNISVKTYGAIGGSVDVKNVVTN